MSMKHWFARESHECRNFEAKTAHKSRSRLPAVAAVLIATMCSLPAWADLVAPIDVSLNAPNGIIGDSTPFTLTQTVSYVSPITNGGGGAIGNFMLADERIALFGNSIQIHVAQGGDAGSTGYGANARYEFSGLSILGSTLTGINVYAFDGYGTSGFSGVSSGVLASLIDTNSDLTLDTLVFRLDSLVIANNRGFGPNSSLNFAEFRIDILSTLDQPPPPPPPPPPNDVPEPGTLVLAAVGLAAVRVVSRRSANAKAGH